MPIDKHILLILLQIRYYDNGALLDKITIIARVGYGILNYV